MNKNGTFLEYATFIFIIAFSFSLTKMQSDHKANLKEQKMLRELQIEQDAANERNWLDRYIRISQNNNLMVKHDGDPSTDLIDVTIFASYSDPEKDDITFEWEYLDSWNNEDDKANILIDRPDLSDDDDNMVDFSIAAGIHEFQVRVTDSYELQAIETITIKVVDEPNAGPAGASEVFESGTRDGCLDANALNYNSKALIDDGSCEYPKDPFKGNTQDIKDFQKKHGLTPDGKWGKKSQAKYDEVEESKKQEEENKPEIKIEVEPSSESNPYDNE